MGERHVMDGEKRGKEEEVKASHPSFNQFIIS